MLDFKIPNAHNEDPAVKPKVLIVPIHYSDHERIALLLRHGGGFEIANTCDEHHVLAEIARLEPQLVVLLLATPDAAGLSVCQRIRKAFNIAIVICATGSLESDIVSGLGAGADDYLVMPMHAAEFTARLRAVVRRAKDSDFALPAGDHLIAGDLEIHLDERRAYARGQEIDLSPTEFRLLTSLMRQAGRPVSHSKLLAQTWGPEYVDARNYIRLYIRRLRSKLEDDPDAPKLIVNDRGVGYRFQPGAAA